MINSIRASLETCRFISRFALTELLVKIPLMPLSWSEFVAHRRRLPLQYFPAAGATRTIAICSHIWWTEQIGLALFNAGFNVAFLQPFYLFYTDKYAWDNFDVCWQEHRQVFRDARVDLLLGGNDSALAVHPRTGERIHHGIRPDGSPIPVVNWWWDDLRVRPALARSGLSPAEYVRVLGDPFTLNAIWDIDVLEELNAQLFLGNLFHLPLATLPEYWAREYVPIENRAHAACFLGICHSDASWTQTDPGPLATWARRIVSGKIASPGTPMQRLIEEASGRDRAFCNDPKLNTGDAWAAFMRPWEILNTTYMHRTRNQMVIAAKRHLNEKFLLVGEGWGAVGLQSAGEFAGEQSGDIYANSQACLNLFGGCVHGGLPLRPYDIGASGGLILTHMQRELPNLLVPGEECLTFQSAEEMLDHLDRVHASPREFDRIAQAGQRRVLAEHTWQHRIEALVAELQRRGLF